MGWSWHLHVIKTWVAKASLGQFPLPFLISDKKELAQKYNKWFQISKYFFNRVELAFYAVAKRVNNSFKGLFLSLIQFYGKKNEE